MICTIVTNDCELVPRDVDQVTIMKPTGLWYSIDYNWIPFAVESGIELGRHLYTIEVDLSKMLVISSLGDVEEFGTMNKTINCFVIALAKHIEESEQSDNR